MTTVQKFHDVHLASLDEAETISTLIANRIVDHKLGSHRQIVSQPNVTHRNTTVTFLYYNLQMWHADAVVTCEIKLFQLSSTSV